MAASLHLFERGFSLRKGARQFGGNRKGGGRRGCLDGSFSSASFRRLREFVVRFSVPGCECWGITLTVPGLELLPVSDFKRIQHRMVVWCNDHRLPLVWRVELQQRKMPHLHCVCYSTLNLVLRLLWFWFKQLHKFTCLEVVDGDFLMMRRDCLKGSSHAVDLQRLSAGFDAFRYLVNHMSKAKQAQLGFPGRNWGVCNKDLFDVDEGNVYDLSNTQYFYIVRWLRRLTRRKIFSSGCSFWVTNPSTVSRMNDYLIKNADDFELEFSTFVRRRFSWVWSSFCLVFLQSIPQKFFDSVFDSIKNDCDNVLQELKLIYLRLLVFYVPFGRKSESFESFPGASLSGESPKDLKVSPALAFRQKAESYKSFLVHPLILPRNVVTAKDKVNWYCEMKRGEV